MDTVEIQNIKELPGVTMQAYSVKPYGKGQKEEDLINLAKIAFEKKFGYPPQSSYLWGHMIFFPIAEE